ncbi:MAG: 50S ribosomal protein L29 [Myxococcota bacterium]
MKATELREMSERELAQLERELRAELFQMRMKHYSGQLQNASELRTKRKDIARVLTVRRELSVQGV